VTLAGLPQVRDPKPMMRMGARAAPTATGGAAGGVPNFMHGQLVRKAGECGDRHHSIVDAHGARKVDWELKAADLPEEDGRERSASHAPSVNRNRTRNNVLSYASLLWTYAGARIAGGGAIGMWHATAPTLSASEQLTLRYIAEGEIHPRELDWVAIQRLRQAKLIEERPGRPGLTPEGRRAWQGILARDWARQR
jgi:hypothetical protein